MSVAWAFHVTCLGCWGLLVCYWWCFCVLILWNFGEGAPSLVQSDLRCQNLFEGSFFQRRKERRKITNIHQVFFCPFILFSFLSILCCKASLTCPLSYHTYTYIISHLAKVNLPFLLKIRNSGFLRGIVWKNTLWELLYCLYITCTYDIYVVEL